MWSTMLPQLVWRADCNAKCLNRVRRKINREVCKSVTNGLGSLIRYPEIPLDQPELYRGDGVHLTEAGLDIFLRDLHRDLHAKFFSLVGGMGHS